LKYGGVIYWRSEMDDTRLTNYPLLPLLTVPQCVQVFKAANMGPTVVSLCLGYSRVYVSGWMNGKDYRAKRTTLDAVSTLAYKVLRALKHKHYPLKKQRGVSRDSFDALLDSVYEKPLSEYSAQELLPKAWLDQINLPEDQDATA
jgi:hypothetical protein